MECPTYMIEHSETKERVVVNAFDYIHGLTKYLGLTRGGKWSIVREDHKGGRAGFEQAKQNTLVVANIRKKRRSEKIPYDVRTK